MGKQKKYRKTKRKDITPEERKLLAESYLRWLSEFGTKEEKEDIVESDGEVFILCSEKEYDYGGLDLNGLGYTPEEIEQSLIENGYYKNNKSAKHFIDYFNYRFKKS